MTSEDGAKSQVQVQEREKEKFSIFTGLQYVTTGGATLLILR